LQVVYLNPNGLLGGAEVALLDTLAGIRDAEPDWNLQLIVSARGPLAAKARALGVGVTFLPFPRSLARIGDSSAGGPAGQQTNRLVLCGRLLLAGPAIAGYVLKLRQVVRRLGPSLIHTNGFKMHVLGALAKPDAVPIIWHIHDYISSRPLMARLMRRFQKRCSLVLANSKSVKADIEAVCGETVKVQTVYNAVDTSVFSPEGPRLDLDELAGLPQPVDSGGSVVRVGLLGTFARWKGQEVFLRALSLVPPELPLRGYIIGGAQYETESSQYSLEELKALARELGVSDRVGFTGFVDQPASAMRSLDIVVHASTQPEPFGLVIIEGMACGRAVIASDAGGAAELFETNVTALGHSPGDAAQLAERIMQLATDPNLRANLGAAGRATVEQRFNRPRLATELIPIYKRVGKQSSEIRSQ
jgi:glycosyltransferase involved in cell wall biosynthesis